MSGVVVFFISVDWNSPDPKDANPFQVKNKKTFLTMFLSSSGLNRALHPAFSNFIVKSILF